MKKVMIMCLLCSFVWASATLEGGGQPAVMPVEPGTGDRGQSSEIRSLETVDRGQDLIPSTGGSPDLSAIVPVTTAEALAKEEGRGGSIGNDPNPESPIPVRPLFAQSGVVVEGFDVAGNTVFSSEELEKVLAAYVGRKVSVEELEAARKALTLHYVEAGYVTSGALLPDQEMTNGRVRFQIVEGVLTGIQVEHVGKKRLYDFMIRAKVASQIKDPFNLNELQNSLQLLDQDPNIRKVDSEIVPTGIPGQSELEMKVKENQPWYVGLLLENHRSPSIGAMRPSLLLLNHNLLGFGDVLSLSYGLTTGKFEYLEPSGFNNLSGSYTIPLNGWGTTLAAGASKSDAVVVEESFAQLLIESKSVSHFLELSHPFYKTLADDVVFSFKAEHKESTTYLLRQSYSFPASGAQKGETIVTALRNSLSGTHRTPNQVISGRATVNWGLNVEDSTITTDGDSDAEFIAFLLQGQFVQRIQTHRLIATFNGQFSKERIVSMEQFAIGGSQTVRGYRENTMLDDNGFNASLEFRYVLWSDKNKNPIFELAPFMDYGRVWDAKESTEEKRLASVGLGGLFHWSDRLDAELYWGYRLYRLTPANDYDFQDDGIHFQVRCRIL